MSIRVQTQSNFMSRDIDIYVTLDGPGRRGVVTEMVVQSIPEGQAIPFAGRILDSAHGTQRELLQAMLEAAWDAGLRPAGYGDTKESMKATTAHLEDMRAIAFHKIGTPKP